MECDDSCRLVLGDVDLLDVIVGEFVVDGAESGETCSYRVRADAKSSFSVDLLTSWQPVGRNEVRILVDELEDSDKALAIPNHQII